MLTDFVPLNPSDALGQVFQTLSKGKKQWVIQNGANSAVGEAVIQLAKSWGLGTINLVRDRLVGLRLFLVLALVLGLRERYLIFGWFSDDIDALKTKLKSLGADHVFTYSEFFEKETRNQIKEIIKGAEMRLALNCVGGKETGDMAKLLSIDGFLG